MQPYDAGYIMFMRDIMGPMQEWCGLEVNRAAGELCPVKMDDASDSFVNLLELIKHARLILL